MKNILAIIYLIFCLKWTIGIAIYLIYLMQSIVRDTKKLLASKYEK